MDLKLGRSLSFETGVTGRKFFKDKYSTLFCSFAFHHKLKDQVLCMVFASVFSKP
mgnify:CR=1 FL=1